MEREAVAQVAPPIYLHQTIPGRFCESSPMTKKRDIPWANPNWQQQQQQQVAAGYQNAKKNWNPKLWDWDSVMFVAKPQEVEGLGLGRTTAELDQSKVGEESQKLMVLKKSSVDEDAENLTLKLGGGSYAVDESVARPNKRVRAGSPGSNYPMCQVDDCRADLSSAKEYHRRHKVCELHSKTTKALVGKQLQRFCQQCSRFHPLPEFDEGKRSCRRRLAGHNRRRRKTQPDDVSSRLLLPGNQDNGAFGNSDIVNLITVLARLQGNNRGEKSSNGPLLPDRDRLLQILSKINSLPVSENNGAKVPVQGGLDLNIPQTSLGSSDNPSNTNGKPPAPSTMDLLAVLSAALAAASPDAMAALFTQGSNSNNGDHKIRPQCVPAKLNCQEQATATCNLQSKESLQTPYSAAERAANFQALGISQSPVRTIRPSIPLQLFSSSPDDESPSKLGSSRKYFSSDSSNIVDETSPSSSPLVQNLFPLHSGEELMKHESMSICREDLTVEACPSHGWSSSLDLFKGSPGRVENGANSNLPYRVLESRYPVPQAGYSSSSGSDHSPSSSSSDGQDRTGRIIFKLFGKDPSNFPVSLRTQILSWLSRSPSDMEGYIRPGCVVLSIYVSMPSTAWEQLEEDLLHRVSALVNSSNSEFWRSGRLLVHTDKQLVSHNDGKMRLCKSWRTWDAPELIFVSPLAVVGGQETSLALRGHNLSAPGTKIHCTFMGGYTSKEASGAGISRSVYEEPGSESFSFPGGASNVLGRCFIEVENGFKGNSFPVIIADAAICRELRILESEFEDDSVLTGSDPEDRMQEFQRPGSREDALHFLNELGWLFQRKNAQLKPNNMDFSRSRFKFLFVFSVERDWPALVKTLLDILVELKSGRDGPWKESLEALSEIHLLNRAVKRKCRKMVDMLLHYSLRGTPGLPKKYLFTPTLAGPGGLTPLHLAAATQNSEDLIDALTDDPQEIGLNAWSLVTDANGQSPYTYALLRNNHSYNRLVGRKLAERRSDHISLTVADADAKEQPWRIAEQAKQRSLQCTACTQCSTEVSKRSRRMQTTRGILHRPYMRSMLAIAAVCVCVCILFRGSPEIGYIAPFKWENIQFGTL